MKAKFPPFEASHMGGSQKGRDRIHGLVGGSKACTESSAQPGELPSKMEGSRMCLLSDQVHWHALVTNAWLFLGVHLLSLSLHMSHVLQGTAVYLKELKKFHRWKKRCIFPSGAIFIGT